MNPKPSCGTLLFSNPDGGVDVVDEASLVAKYEDGLTRVATIGERVETPKVETPRVEEPRVESSKVEKVFSVEEESKRIVGDLVKALASPLMREAIKDQFISSNLMRDVQAKEVVLEKVEKPVSKDEDPRALTNKEKDGLYKARKGFKDLGINLEKGKDLNQVQSQLEFVKAILANKEKVEELINTYDITKPIPKTLKKKSSPSMFSIPCTLGDHEVKDAFCDSGSFVSVISSKMVEDFKLEGMQPCKGNLTFGDQSVKQTKGVFKDFPIKLGGCIVPTDLLVLDMVDDKRQALLLGIPFMETAGAKLDYVNRVVSFEFIDKDVFYPLDKKCDQVWAIFKESPVFTVNETTDGVTSEPQEAPKPPTKKKNKRKKKVKSKEEVVSKVMVNGDSTTPIAPSLIFKPKALVDGKLECKIKSSYGSKPFGKVKIVLSSVDQVGEGSVLNDKMIKTFGIKLGDRGPNLKIGPSLDH